MWHTTTKSQGKEKRRFDAGNLAMLPQSYARIRSDATATTSRGEAEEGRAEEKANEKANEKEEAEEAEEAEEVKGLS